MPDTQSAQSSGEQWVFALATAYHTLAEYPRCFHRIIGKVDAILPKAEGGLGGRWIGVGAVRPWLDKFA